MVKNFEPAVFSFCNIDEIFQLTEKASARHPDPSTERRVEGIRRELLGEIQLLQSQLQINSAKGNNAHMSDTQLMSMNRDILEMYGFLLCI